MKKSFLAFLLLGVFAVGFNSCKKDDDNGGSDDDGPVTPTENFWVIGGVTYAANPVLGTIWNEDELALVAASSNNSIIAVSFSQRPTSSGSFAIKDAAGNQEDLAANECSVGIITPTAPNLYFSTGKSGDVLNVTVSGNKITAVFNNVEFAFLDGSEIKTTTGRGNLKEK